MLHYNTVTPVLLKALNQLMSAREFKEFRLVGGTALSLIRGHRLSVDIDLFTDVEYDSMNFKAIDKYLKAHFAYIDASSVEEVGFGKSYFIGSDKENLVKLDLFYTDPFIFSIQETDGIRLATTEEIMAMKMDVILRGGRKKDFWDIHEMMENYSFKVMLQLHEKRNPWNHDSELIRKQFANFETADTEADPVCLRGKIWELIKLDMVDFIN